MKNYIYKCVSFLLEPYNEKYFLTNTARTYEKVLNEAGKDGWELVKIDTISPVQQDINDQAQNSSTEATVCAKVLIFKKNTNASFDKSSKAGFDLMENKTKCPACKSDVNREDLYCENCSCKLK